MVDGIREKHEEQTRIDSMIERGLREAYFYVQELVQAGGLELDPLETVYSVAESLKQAVREALVDELEGTETEEHVKKLVQETIRDKFDM